MEPRDISRLDVGSIAADDSVLLMWTTMPFLQRSFAVIEGWGFAYKTMGFVWVKTYAGTGNIALGMGYYTRSNAELCLLATRGKGLKRVSTSVSQVVLSPRGRHSTKPPEVRDRIVRLFGDVPRIELFARDSALGWDNWGNEIETEIRIQMKEER
jgi:N6-adenosine-specific RNA methylase IME4